MPQSGLPVFWLTFELETCRMRGRSVNYSTGSFSGYTMLSGWQRISRKEKANCKTQFENNLDMAKTFLHTSSNVCTVPPFLGYQVLIKYWVTCGQCIQRLICIKYHVWIRACYPSCHGSTEFAQANAQHPGFIWLSTETIGGLLWSQ
jgi:hypothetical protein